MTIRVCSLADLENGEQLVVAHGVVRIAVEREEGGQIHIVAMAGLVGGRIKAFLRQIVPHFDGALLDGLDRHRVLLANVGLVVRSC